jgi:two-component system, chemotaxis family, protein-glutamate methylesterase/glutaminase
MLAVSSLAGNVDAIVIGASAGGIEALSALLPALPRGGVAAVFVVLHLPRDRDSLLADIFRPRCAFAVFEAEDKEPVSPGSIYFAPPDYHLLVDEGPRLALSVDEPVMFSRPSIDVLFESAADLYGPRLLGIVLSGANGDGAEGLKKIRAAGGLAWVQDPAEAKAALMPETALKQVPDSQVLSLAQMTSLLATLVDGGTP